MSEKKHDKNKTKRIEQIRELLQEEYLTARQISQFTGLSRDRGQEIRRGIIERYKSTCLYSNHSPVKTEHFLEYYDSRKLHSIYEDLFNIRDEYTYANHD